ncbi:serine protease prots [Microdochium bolleyi]|uniref:Serine protease prots n=1 Tax=Microdochium bolleyi TaxID=196109 RepID=A0A136ISG8_9PEZI|nr:serine protease prots [Microdochium bolleyi]
MRSAVLLGLLPLALAAPVVEKRAPLHVPRGATGNSYIVKMKAGAANEIGIQAVQPEADKEFPNLGAFSATLGDADVEQLRNNPEVEFVEKEHEMSIFAPVTQTGATWGLSRLSSDNTGATSYTYDSSAGEGACVYVIDTGVEVEHPEFEGRASLVANTIDNDPVDRHGHGTHVSGTVGSKTYGVAKKSTIFGVKVFDARGSSNNSVILAAMDFVLGDFQSKAARCPKGFVVNMSLGGSASEAIDNGVAQLVDAGLAVAVASGNGDRITGLALDANGFSPARYPGVCTVGATDSTDKVGRFSNYGTAVDIHAPGVSIQSTIPGGRVGSNTGTSMASPHIAGLMAYFLGLGATTPAAACDYIAANALVGRISSLGPNTKNLLAHVV